MIGLCVLAWVMWGVYRRYWDHQLQLLSSRELVGKRIDGGQIVGVDEARPYWVICRDHDGDFYVEAHKVRCEMAIGEEQP